MQRPAIISMQRYVCRQHDNSSVHADPAASDNGRAEHRLIMAIATSKIPGAKMLR